MKYPGSYTLHTFALPCSPIKGFRGILHNFVPVLPDNICTDCKPQSRAFFGTKRLPHRVITTRFNCYKPSLPESGDVAAMRPKKCGISVYSTNARAFHRHTSIRVLPTAAVSVTRKRSMALSASIISLAPSTPGPFPSVPFRTSLGCL